MKMTDLATKIQFVRAACDACGIPDNIVANITTLYGEKHRAYHNIEHIYDLLQLANAYHDSHAIHSTIIFHDIVYYPGCKFNEELSASAYRDWHARFYDEMGYRAIIASKNHTAEWNDKLLPFWAKEFLDYDLYGLATDKYKENAQKIWKEFEPFVEAGTFINGRVKFLHTMLESKRIYWNHPEWEAEARSNMHEELTYLREDHYSISHETSVSDVEYTYGTVL